MTEVKAKERPILLNGAQVRAVLEGRKTQHRQVVKPQPKLNDGFWELFGAAWSDGMRSVPAVYGHSLSTRNPFGQPGDRLWVRETWWQVGEWCQSHPEDDEWATWEGTLAVHYDTDGRPHVIGPNNWGTPPGPVPESDRWIPYAGGMNWRKRPSIHMPRWASRITLEITGVRVERLQEITEADARAEGCFGRDPEPKDEGGTIYAWEGRSSAACPRAHFSAIWNAINGAGSWAANPWVWAIEFKRVVP